MATVAELASLARRISTGELGVLSVMGVGRAYPEEWLALTKDERSDVLIAAAHMALQRLRRSRRTMRRSFGVLRSWLSPEQREQLRRSRCILVRGSEGGLYRLWPETHRCEQVARHGKRWFGTGVSFCLHDPERVLPPPDVSLAHLLMLRTDEPGFLSQANHHWNPPMMWDGGYRGRLRAARDARLEAERATRLAIEAAA